MSAMTTERRAEILDAEHAERCRRALVTLVWAWQHPDQLDGYDFHNRIADAEQLLSERPAAEAVTA